MFVGERRRTSRLLGLARVTTSRTRSRIASFSLEEPIGGGSHGVVWRATHVVTEQVVAVKLLRPEAFDPLSLDRFRYEARALAIVDHSGVARVIDSGVDSTDGVAQPYLAVELIDGAPLDRFAEQLGFTERLDLFVRVCQAVQAVHEHGLIHRDLTPSNILVLDNGQPKLIDFGLARPVKAKVDHRAWRTEAGAVVGTLAFASPEQASGETGQVGVRSDVYSLGATLHTMLTGSPPLDIAALPLLEQVRRIREQEPNRPSHTEPAAAGDVDAVVAKALAKRPEERYSSAAALAEDVENVLAGAPVRARTYSIRSLVTRWVRRRKRFVAAAAAVVGFSIAALVVSLLGWRHANEARRATVELLDRLIEWASQIERTNISAARQAELLGHLGRWLPVLDSSGVRDVVRWRIRSVYAKQLGNLEHDAGRYQQALEHRREALGLLLAVAKVEKSDTHGLSTAHVKLADSLRQCGLPGASRLFDEALAIDEARWASSGDVEDLSNVVWGHERIAVACSLSGDHERAVASFRAMSDLAATLFERRPNSADSLEARAAAQVHVARIGTESESTDLGGLLRAHETALALRREALRLDPYAPFRAERVLVSLVESALVATRAGQRNHNTEAEARQLATRLIREHPARPVAKLQLALIPRFEAPKRGISRNSSRQPPHRISEGSRPQSAASSKATAAFESVFLLIQRHTDMLADNFPALSLTAASLVALVASTTTAQEAWAQRWPITAPSARSTHGMVFDTAANRTVLFGGASSITSFGDTWSWDGANWTQLFPTAPPPARRGHGFAWDGARAILFGGDSPFLGSVFSDTWSWSGSVWTQLSPAATPSARSANAMVYDVDRGEVVLFGGTIGSDIRLDDTWVFTGGDWLQRSPAATPVKRSHHAMAYDPVRMQTVLFGGLNDGPLTPASGLDDTWVWDAATWVQKNPTTRPPGRWFHTMAWDSSRARVVLHGGEVYLNGFLSDTWEWDGTTWEQQSPMVTPLGRSAHAMAYDAARGETVLFGGATPSLRSDTWVRTTGVPIDWITNGSFEDPRISPPFVANISAIPGWSVSTVDLLGVFPNNGLQAVDLVGSPGLGVISQTVPVVAGTTYSLRFFLRSQSSNIMNAVQVLWEGTPIAVLDVGPTYTEHQFPVVASSGLAVVQFAGLSFEGNQSGPILDDVSLFAAPVDAVPPTAEPGPDQAIHAGDRVDLDGSQSFDDTTASEDLLYPWLLIAQPAGSVAVLGPDPNDPANPASQSFQANLPGDYRVELTVTDEAGNVSPAEEVVVSSENVAPTANAGEDQVVAVGTAAPLDSMDSTDPDGDPLAYNWTLLSAPSGSAAALVAPNSATPSFTPDLVGSYVIQLVVNDGLENSSASNVTVTAISLSDAAQDKLREAADRITALTDSAFHAKGHRNFFANKIGDIIALLQTGNLDSANKQLEKVIARTDGCSLRGLPDPKGKGQANAADFITDCTAAQQVYALLQEALSLVGQ